MYAYKMAKHSPSENSSDFYAMAYKDWKGIDLVSYNIIKSKLLTIFYKISHVIKWNLKTYLFYIKIFSYDIKSKY